MRWTNLSDYYSNHCCAPPKVSIDHSLHKMYSYLVVYQHGDDAPNVVLLLPHRVVAPQVDHGVGRRALQLWVTC